MKHFIDYPIVWPSSAPPVVSAKLFCGFVEPRELLSQQLSVHDPSVSSMYLRVLK